MSRWKKQKLAVHETTGVTVARRYGDIQMIEHRQPSARARLAMSLSEHLSFATCMPTGEFDKAGRSISRLLTPKEVATRACELADCMTKEFESRDWLVPMPIEEILKNEEDSNDA